MSETRLEYEATTDQDNRCPVCLESAGTTVNLRCGHLMCTSCLDTYLQNFNNCPICRNPIEDEHQVREDSVRSIEEHLQSLITSLGRLRTLRTTQSAESTDEYRDKYRSIRSLMIQAANLVIETLPPNPSQDQSPPAVLPTRTSLNFRFELRTFPADVADHHPTFLDQVRSYFRAHV